MSTQMANDITLNPSALTAALQLCFKARRSTMTWGGPGGGKSQIHEQAARGIGYNILDVRLPLLDAVDLRGIPTVVKGVTKWAVPDFLPNVDRDGENGVLFLDEFNAGLPIVQAACYQLLIHPHRLGEYQLPEGWTVAAAGNYDSDGAFTARMSTANRNRLTHFHYKVSLDDFCNHAIANDFDPAVVAFVRFREELLQQFDKTALAFPTPRSWEFTSDIVKQHPAPNVQLALIAGCVGPGAASEFIAFLQLYKGLPSIDAILLNPDIERVPKDNASLMYAVAVALAQKMTANNFGTIMRYLGRCEPEYCVMAVKNALAKTPTLTSSKEFTKFAAKYGDLLS